MTADSAPVDFGYASRTVRTRAFSIRIGIRLAVVSLVLFSMALLMGLAALHLGEYPVPLSEVLAIFAGGGDEFNRLVVWEWRLPVALAAIGFGAILGVGGAIFQSLTRNPLGSPDVIGFDAGAYTAVVVVMLLLRGGDYLELAGAAILGGIATALAVYLLAWRRGIQGFRLIIVGIGVSAILGSINAYLISRAELEEAITVGYWGAGSIAQVSWPSLTAALSAGAVILTASGLLGPALRRLELGDDAALTQGTRVGAVRLALLLLGVSTTALVTAAAGPIGFIALAAPQLARRLTRTPGVSLLAAAAMGAVLLSAAHLIALLFAHFYRPVPVGLVTVCVGGCYLIWVLIHEARRQAGGAR